ncbi:MAG: hypothetical protein IT189_02950 [Microbacteriaceae bacterium]|nr:hypothetical protein [Actinomycetota bacterium]MCC6855000.1 hypothetical protein [Microbacteriaceae bacterium]HQG70572.1 hypothetical protein [Rhodoglobus sp.]
MTTSPSSGLAALALATVFLAGCSATAPATPPDPAGSAGGNSPAEPCIVGVWDLDVGDYEAQSILYINSLAVPMEDFTLTGSQTLSVTADGLFRLDTNITTAGNMVIDSYMRAYTTTTTGLSTAEWSPGESGTIELADWVDDLETTGDAPEDSGLGGGVGFGSIPTVNMTCEGDGLTLSGLDLPLDSHWTRQ